MATLSSDGIGAEPRSLKACSTCAKVKAKCIFTAEASSICERCERLGKECNPRSAAPPRPKKALRRSKVAELEQRLDQLSSKYDASQQSTAVAAVTAAAADAGLANNSSSSSASYMPTLTIDSLSSEEEDIVRPLSMKRKAWGLGGFAVPLSIPLSPIEVVIKESLKCDQAAVMPWDSLWPRPAEAAEMLAQFRDCYGLLTPFVVIPPELTERELFSRSPFVWKAVMFRGCFLDGARSVKLGRELLADITHACMLEGKKSIDLLQSLIILVTWFYYGLNSTQLINLLYLARSMCVCLDSEGDLDLFQQRHLKGDDLEYMRLYAGTYYLNTLIFTTNKRTDVLMDSSYLETCCRVLDSTKDVPTDEYLVRLVRIQQISSNISAAKALDPENPSMQLPAAYLAQTFLGQIEEFQASLPVQLKTDLLMSHVYIAKVLVTEIGLHDEYCSPDKVTPSYRVQLLADCLSSCTSYFGISYSSRVVDRPRFPCISSSELIYCILVSMRLLTATVPGWDLDEISRELRLSQVLSWHMEDLELIVDTRRNGLFSRIASGVEEPLGKLVSLSRRVGDIVRAEVEEREAGSQISAHATQEFFDELIDPCWQSWPTYAEYDQVGIWDADQEHQTV